MDPADLIERYPFVWHTALLANRDSIRQHGLLSSTAILEKAGVADSDISQLTRQRRPESVAVQGAHGRVVLRDQKPMQAHNLRLQNISEGDWYAMLNSRVFFWMSESRLNNMLKAPPYKNHRHLVLQVDTATLVERHHLRIELSKINSGATIFPNAPSRGRDTFKPMVDYPHREAAELTVLGGVPDIVEMLVAVEIRQHGEPVEDLGDL